MSNVHPKFPQLDAAAVAALKGRSLLKTADFNDGEIKTLLSVAAAFEALDRAGVKTELCPDELAYALFFDNSTRTKSAWAGAAARLGMSPVIADGSSTQVAHGETTVETGAMLGMNAHALGVRHDLILGEGQAFIQDIHKGITDYLGRDEQDRTVPVVNLQCDLDHPTQTLADAQFLLQKFGGSLEGKKVAMTWAYSPSYAKPLSVPQGIAMLLPRLGANVVLAHPPGYELQDEPLRLAREGAARSGGSFEIVDSMDAAFQDADIVYPKSWGPLDLMLERVKMSRDKNALADIERRALERNAQHKDWIADERRMALTKGGDAAYCHCLPADIGAEVTPGVMEKYRLDLAQEAQKKVYVIMALLAMAKVDGLAGKLEALNNRS